VDPDPVVGVQEKQSLVTEEIDPNRVFRRVLAGWPLILILAVLGGLVGYGLSYLRPPLYEAASALGIDIDYARAVPLDDNARHDAFQRVRELLLADDTLEATRSLLGGAAPADLQALRQHLRLENRAGRWDLIVVDPDPQAAARLANAWAESALTQLEEASLHAWRAADLQSAFFALGCRLEPNDQGEAEGVGWVCEIGVPTPGPDTLIQALQEEASLSRGILPAMSFSLLERVSAPAAPVIRGRGSLVLAGALIGLLLGAGLALSRDGRWLWQQRGKG
jgi:uncharacterized protein involved in exopolysaccharide biosynthesis